MIWHHRNVLEKCINHMGLLYLIPAVEANYQPEIDIFPELKKITICCPS